MMIKLKIGMLVVIVAALAFVVWEHRPRSEWLIKPAADGKWRGGLREITWGMETTGWSSPVSYDEAKWWCDTQGGKITNKEPQAPRSESATFENVGEFRPRGDSTNWTFSGYVCAVVSGQPSPENIPIRLEIHSALGDEKQFLTISNRAYVQFDNAIIVRVNDAEWAEITNHYSDKITTNRLTFYGK